MKVNELKQFLILKIFRMIEGMLNILLCIVNSVEQAQGIKVWKNIFIKIISVLRWKFNIIEEIYLKRNFVFLELSFPILK